MRRTFWKLVALCGLVLGCSSSQSAQTEIVVLVYSDLKVGSEIDTVRIDAVGGNNQALPMDPIALSGNPWPLRFSLISRGNENTAFYVRATGLFLNSPVVSQEVTSSCLPNQRKVLVLTLYRSCSPVVDCGQGLTCKSGKCEIAAVAAAGLPDYDPAHLPVVPASGTKQDGGAPDVPALDSGIDGGLGQPDGLRDSNTGEASAPDAATDSAQDVAADISEVAFIDLAAATGGSGGADADFGTGGSGGSGGVGGGGSGGSTGAVECAPLTDPASGSVTVSGRTPGSTAAYTCVSGYSISGIAERSCQGNGTWSGAAPACAPVDCGAPQDLADGKVETSATTFGSTAKYTCPVGTSTTDALTSTCQSDRKWSNPAPTCTTVTCPDLQNPSDGTVIVSGKTYSSTASYTCATGHTLTGAPTVTCAADGTWSPAPPTCPPVNCGSLTAPEFGTVSAPVTTYGADATYACTGQHSILGSSTRKCEATGRWSGTAPTCQVDCLQPKDPLRGGTNVTTTTPQSIAYYYCKPGLTMFGSSTTTCGAEGNWSGSPPTCVCSNGNLPANWGSDCQYTCPTGTVVTGTINCNGCTDSAGKCASP
jgi:hypothetical protein